MIKEIGTVIQAHRRKNGLSQIDLANKLEQYDIHVKNAAISSWEKNVNTPTAAQLLAICEILGISDIYTEFIGENPNDPFHGLSEEGISKAKDYLDLLRASGQFQVREAEIIPFEPRRMKVSLLPTSAGLGEYLDNENFEEVEIYDPVPKRADFGVRLNGDSMEPRFKNEELVWIEQTCSIDSGEIGLFYLNGMTYFKKYLSTKAGTFLTSLNAKYTPIQIKSHDTFKVFGKLALD